MNTAIIVGAGKGERMNSKTNKILLNLAGKPLIYHSIRKFEDNELIDNIILVINEEDEQEINSLIERYNFKKINKIVYGGKERQDSVYNGIKAIGTADKEDIILIHNAANPYVDDETINNTIEIIMKIMPQWG